MKPVEVTDAVPQRSHLAAIVLLAAQAFSLGLMVAWVTIAASATFLDTYGSGALPATYIGAAVAGALASLALARSFRRRSLVWVTIRVLAALAVLFALSFVLLRFSGPSTSIALLVLIPILVPVGFMFVVGQAGMLLDVRALKALYARVVAGFAFGFVVGGLAAPALLAVFGRSDVLLALAAIVAFAFLILVRQTQRKFSAELSFVDAIPVDLPRPTLRSLLRDRYVMLIVAFQMLSAIESQWLDFLVFDRAAQRYTTSEQLAEFIGRFTAIAYGTDILFLLLVAGLLLRRFGLRYGLTANAVVVLSLVVATVVAGSVQGSATTLVFVLVVASRVSDLTLSDGTARTSLSAAYQAVPLAQRLVAQATVEGLAVPVAIGASGVALIVMRHTIGTNGVALSVATAVVVALWVVVAVGVYRSYRVNLLANLRHRVLDPATIMIEDAATLAAINRLIDDGDEREVRLGLQTLAAAHHPDLPLRLELLATDQRAGVRSYALNQLAEIDWSRASAAARSGVSRGEAAARSVSLRALTGTGTAADLPVFVTNWSDPEEGVRLAAAAGIARHGDERDRALLSAEIARCASEAGAPGPIFAARLLGECRPVSGIDRSPLAALLTSSAHEVVLAALSATCWPDDEPLLPLIVVHLEPRRTSAATVDALARGGPAMLQVVDDGLAGRNGLSGNERELLVRVALSIGHEAVPVLQGHVGDRDREVARASLRALADLMSPASGSTLRGSFQEALDAVIREDVELAAQSLQAMSVLPSAGPFMNLQRALSDELALAQERLLSSLAIRYGSNGVSVVSFRLAQTDARAHALALEWLDVTLVGADRAVVPLVVPGLSTQDRLLALGRWVSLPPAPTATIMRDLMSDPDDRWRRPWLIACAILAAANSDDPTLRELLYSRSPSPAELRGDHSGIVHETLASIPAGRQLASGG